MVEPATVAPASTTVGAEAEVAEVSVAKRRVLVVAAVFPEPRSTAAGVRTWAILRCVCVCVCV
jgi:hypothetical protein